MKNIAWIVAVTVIGVAIYAAAGPYLTIGAIKTGIVENDAELLADNIEFPTLRQNLKEQLNSAVMRSAAKEADDNPLGVLFAGLASSLVDGLVDNFVTPSALASVMEGREPPTESTRSTRSPSTADREELFRDARMTYDSLNKFSVWVPNDAGGETRFVLKRDGLSWKLVNMVIPLDDLD
jgi:hypothetical protein